MKISKITQKMLIFSIIIGLATILLTTWSMSQTVLKYIDQLETNLIEKRFNEINLILARETNSLVGISRDWACWDDTYFYMAGELDSYEEKNLQEDIIKKINLNIMLFFNTDGTIVKSVRADMNNDRFNAFEEKLTDKVNELLKSDDSEETHTGIINIDGAIFIISIAPITTSDETAISNGTLLIGRKIDKEIISYISNLLDAAIVISDNPPAASESTIVVEKTEKKIDAYSAIKDINGAYEINVGISMPRTEYSLGKYYIRLFIDNFLILFTVIVIFAVGMTQTHIINRLSLIHNFIKNVAKTQDTSKMLSVPYNDEITDISNSINLMLAELTDAYKKKKETDVRVRTILESIDDGYIEHNLKTNDYYISPKWSQVSEAEKNQPAFDPLAAYFKRINPDFWPEANAKLKALIEGEKDYDEMEYTLTTLTGELIWVLHKVKIVERDHNGKALRMVCSLLNISARKEFEEKIVKLSYYDAVTGLWNRHYIEEQLSELANHPDLDYFIIMGDVNGLKLVNDTFGHKDGDSLIVKISRILCSVSEPDDIIARWGGDEFVLFIKNKSDSYVVRLIEKIQEECRNVKTFGFSISIALGSASSKERPTLEAVMSLAEEKMYRNKMTEEKSVRSATIVSLEKTLYEKHSETEEHTQRIKKLALRLGENLHLANDQLHELELLSLLHDIGKIGIPEHILMKPGKLTDDEFATLKEHTEIGYRIAKATPGLTHVAEEILSHHEKYDGTGYPRGLAGINIPILARIINVIDSFDVMTHKRIYKEASTYDYAVSELIRCSGSQFDPMIVTEFLKLLEERGNPF